MTINRIEFGKTSRDYRQAETQRILDANRPSDLRARKLSSLMCDIHRAEHVLAKRKAELAALRLEATETEIADAKDAFKDWKRLAVLD